MSMQHTETELRRTGDPRKQAFADVIAGIRKSLGSDIPLPSVATPVAKPEITIISRDQLILPHKELPKEVSDILKRAEKAGIGVFEAYRLSDITLQQDSSVEGWNKKPNNWYWEQIRNGNISQDAPRLPDSWVLIDKTQKPDYRDGQQLHQNDPFGPLLKRLRKEGKIQTIKGIPDTSRFGISHDELTQAVLPEIAKLLGAVGASQVRLPKAIEFSVIGNIKHPEWGETNTWEWFNDSFEGGRRLIGGHSDFGGLTEVDYSWSGDHDDSMTFRPLVVVSPKT